MLFNIHWMFGTNTKGVHIFFSIYTFKDLDIVKILEHFRYERLVENRLS